MEKSTKASVFACLAAAFFGIDLLYLIASYATGSSGRDGSGSVRIFSCIILIVLIVFLVLRNKVGTMVGSILFVMLHAIIAGSFYEEYIFETTLQGGSGLDGLNGVIWLLGMAAFLCMMVLMILSLARKQVAAYMWFFPAALRVMGMLLRWNRPEGPG